jgi:tetratricopeptide (TPR) repeat protein
VELNQAIDLNPGESRNFFNKAVILYDQKEYRLALENYERAIQVDPNQAIYHTNRGTTLVAMGFFEEAIGSYNRALELSPRLFTALISKGWTYHDMGLYNEAIDTFDGKNYVLISYLYNYCIQLSDTILIIFRGNTVLSRKCRSLVC